MGHENSGIFREFYIFLSTSCNVTNFQFIRSVFFVVFLLFNVLLFVMVRLFSLPFYSFPTCQAAFSTFAAIFLAFLVLFCCGNIQVHFVAQNSCSLIHIKETLRLPFNHI